MEEKKEQVSNTTTRKMADNNDDFTVYRYSLIGRSWDMEVTDQDVIDAIKEVRNKFSKKCMIGNLSHDERMKHGEHYWRKECGCMYCDDNCGVIDYVTECESYHHSMCSMDDAKKFAKEGRKVSEITRCQMVWDEEKADLTCSDPERHHCGIENENIRFMSMSYMFDLCSLSKTRTFMVQDPPIRTKHRIGWLSGEMKSFISVNNDGQPSIYGICKKGDNPEDPFPDIEREGRKKYDVVLNENGVHKGYWKMTGPEFPEDHRHVVEHVSSPTWSPRITEAIGKGFTR